MAMIRTIPSEKEQYKAKNLRPAPARPASPWSGQELDELVTDALVHLPPPHPAGDPPLEEGADRSLSPYRGGEMDMSEAQAKVEAMIPFLEQTPISIITKIGPTS